MPNWCENTMTINGDAKDIARFKKLAKAKDTDLSLAKLYPEPNYDEVKVKPTFPAISGDKDVDSKSAWWDWRVQNWGTKWDLDAQLIDSNETSLIYEFLSAWSPPVEWLRKVAADFPTLTFLLDYDEPGVGFKGYAKAENGEVEDSCASI